MVVCCVVARTKRMRGRKKRSARVVAVRREVAIVVKGLLREGGIERIA